jgi:hypothetical protein
MIKLTFCRFEPVDRITIKNSKVGVGYLSLFVEMSTDYGWLVTNLFNHLQTKKEVLPRFELGLLDSESNVLTITP